MTAPGAGQSGLVGCRVLVVEDELMIAEVWAVAVTDCGGEIVGPFPRVASALRAIERETRLDAAILDVQLHGETVLPVADVLASRGVPFVFTTGYGPAGVPARYRDRPVLTKPCLVRTLLATLARLTAGPE